MKFFRNISENKRETILLILVLLLSGILSSCKPNPTQPDTTTAGISVAITGETCPNIEVQVGQQVTWTNQDNHEHFVREKSAEGASKIDSGTLQQGDSFMFTFMVPGNFTYECTSGSGITGTVTVQP